MNILKNINFWGVFALICAFIIIKAEMFKLAGLLLTISVFIKSGLLIFLPFFGFACLIHAFTNMRKSDIWIILPVIIIVLSSNFLASIVSYIASGFIKNNLHSLTLISEHYSAAPKLSPFIYWDIHLFLLNELAVFSGFVLGIILSLKPSEAVIELTKTMYSQAFYILNRVFMPIMPIMITGYMCKILYESGLEFLITSQGYLLIISLVILFGYILLMFLAVSKFSPAKAWRYIKNLGTPSLVGFNTMSSTVTIPYSVKSSNVNTRNTKISGFFIPSASNVHLIGDSIIIPIVAITLITSFGYQAPDLYTYIIFACYFSINKFLVPAIRGGGIMVMIPVLEEYLGMTEGMISIIYPIYFLLDPFITLANVLGNNAIVIFVNEVYKVISRQSYT
jgi:Na+/H+-dicarboxylate symporter